MPAKAPSSSVASVPRNRSPPRAARNATRTTACGHASAPARTTPRTWSGVFRWASDSTTLTVTTEGSRSSELDVGVEVEVEVGVEVEGEVDVEVDVPDPAAPAARDLPARSSPRVALGGQA